MNVSRGNTALVTAAPEGTDMKAETLKIFDAIAERFIAAIETAQATGEWNMPWRRALSGPVNPLNGNHEYQGFNRLLLAMMGISFAAGKGQVFKAVKAHKLDRVDLTDVSECVICFPRIVKDEDGESRIVGWGFRPVVNLAEIPQFAGIIREATPDLGEPIKRCERVERFIQRIGVPVTHGGNQAFHRPADNTVTLPQPEQFNTPEDYYATLLHEAVHWTNVEARTGRKKANAARFEGWSLRKLYAFEELVAELGSSFLCADFGVHQGYRESHAEYLAGWAGILREDSTMLRLASMQAQQAIAYMYGLERDAMDREREAS
jgi:antirestriction protein ArdC